ncbi:MAG: hypothetical protein K2P93_04615 [Alphaproteobacteria bacterium]|nr:hypothetical protein [Alphaproteobacteria bacterium]
MSPPWLLSLDNSMGAFKGVMMPEEYLYGEAIIEVRGIRRVEDWILRRTPTDERRKEHFLEDASERLILEAIVLFDFFNNFVSPEVFDDVNLRMTYTTYRHSEKR